MRWFNKLLAAGSARLLMALGVALVGNATVVDIVQASVQPADVSVGYVAIGDFDEHGPQSPNPD